MPVASPDKKLDVKEAPKPLTFEESNLGQLVKGATEAQKTPEELAKRMKARRKRTATDKPDEEVLKESADQLAAAGKQIEVKKGPDGQETVEMKLDLSKMRDLSSFTPDVKGFNVKFGTKQPDGTEKFGDEKVVFRQTEGGKIGYFYKDEKGKFKELELPVDGTAAVTIAPEQYDKKSPTEVLHLMAEEIEKATSQLALKDVSHDFLGGMMSPSSRRSAVIDSGAGYDPDRSSFKGKVGSVDLKMPEVVDGPLDTETEIVPAGKPPTGEAMTINYSKNPELMAKEPCYIYSFHGDGGSMGAYLAEATSEVDALRKAGVNAILIVPEYDTSKGTDNRWRYLDEKCDAMFDFVFEKFKKPGKINLTSFSGGYRAVASILANSKHRAEINSVSMLDSTYPDSNDPVNKLLAKFVQDGGNVKAFTGQGAATEAGVSAIKAELAKNPGTGSFEHIDTNLSHGRVNKDYLQAAMAFAGNVQLEEIKSPEHDSDSHDHEVASAGSRTLKYPMSDEARKIIESSYNRGEGRVVFKDDYSNPPKSFELSETTYKCYELARKFAKAQGFDIMVKSGYRSVAEQTVIYNNAKPENRGKMVAAPGKSNHQKGKAVDCCLVDSSGKQIKTAQAKDFLEKCMNQAGFVRYSVEWWHFEVGSRPWEEIISRDSMLAKVVGSGSKDVV